MNANTTNITTLPRQGAISAMHGTLLSRDAAFHGIGVDLTGIRDVREALGHAGLAWKVESRPTYVRDPYTGGFQELENARALVREDGVVLGERVSPRYKPIQNEAVFDSLQTALDGGLIALESAGSMQGGKRIYVLARGTQEIKVRGVDQVNEFHLFTFGHSGDCAMYAIPSAYRIACANAISAAVARAKKTPNQGFFSIPHVGDVSRKISGVVNAISRGQKKFREFMDVMDLFAGLQVNVREMGAFVRYLFPRNEEERQADALPSRRTAEKRDTILELFERGDGANGHDEVRGTAWQAFNAVTEHANHAARGLSQEKREKALISLYEGVNAALARRAMVALETFYVRDTMPEEFEEVDA
jgi:phage/plasmid-like protein (TIGR03299 family)